MRKCLLTERKLKIINQAHDRGRVRGRTRGMMGRGAVPMIGGGEEGGQRSRWNYGTGLTDVLYARRSTRSRVDHFGRGLQVVAVAATTDRCNTSATGRVVRLRRRYFRSSFASSVSVIPLSFASWPFLQLPSFSFFLPLCLLFSYVLTDSTVPHVSTLRYHLAFLPSYPLSYPSDSFQNPRNDVLRTY